MSEIGTNKVFIWKSNLEYLDIGEIKINKTEDYKYKRDGITQNLFTGLKSVDDFNELYDENLDRLGIWVWVPIELHGKNSLY